VVVSILMQKYKIYVIAFLGALALFILFGWFREILSGEEGRVRKFIMKGKTAVESKNLFACANIISMSYSDKYGNDRQALIYGSKEFFNYYSSIFVDIKGINIKLDDSKTHAVVDVTALVIGKNKDNNPEKILEGIESERGRFRIKAVKEDKQWRLLELEFFESLQVMGENIG